DGHAGFSFTKLDEKGDPLEDQSVKYATTPWSCVKDNVTGLVWEVKQNLDYVLDDNNIHDADNKYKWGGKTAQGTGYGDYYFPDWDKLVDGSNDASFCGFKDWRVPTINELENLVSFDGKGRNIDTDYFPNTSDDSPYFWSASPYARDSDRAWDIYFDAGRAYTDNADRDFYLHVRLVRSGQ
ncbi:MAG: DUF1566 domain-containing protein, partial [Desulfobacterales bacterium]|nr:DUF1566 domain-containing protein [Desulfobacterales bacterium]